MNASAKITVSIRTLRAVMPSAAEKDVRFYLNGVALFKPKAGPGVLAVATDGPQCAFCLDEHGTWEGDDPGPVIIGRGTEAARVEPYGLGWLRLALEGGAA